MAAAAVSEPTSAHREQLEDDAAILTAVENAARVRSAERLTERTKNMNENSRPESEDSRPESEEGQRGINMGEADGSNQGRTAGAGAIPAPRARVASSSGC